MELKDKVNLGIAVGAFVIAVLSLVLSYHAFQKRTREYVHLTTGFYKENYQFQVQEGMEPFYSIRVPLRWRCLIVNNGLLPVTFMNVHADQYNRGFSEDFRGELVRFLEEEDMVEVEFPFTLNNGKSKSVIVVMEVPIASDVYDLVSSEFPIGVEALIMKFRLVLARHGVDLYGNEVKLTEYEDETYVYSYPSATMDRKEILFTLTFETSRGNKFSVGFSEFRQF